MKIQQTSFKKTLSIILSLSIVLLLISLISLTIGAVNIPLQNIANLLLNKEIEENYRIIILQLRLPRILMAIFVGGGLSISGVVLQALLRNPLAEPYILGISSGGTLGAVIALSFGFTLMSIPLLAFLGAVLVILVVFLSAEYQGKFDSNRLLLTGIMIGAFLNSLILLIMVIKHRETKEAFLWLIGNLSSTNTQTLYIVIPIVILAFIFVYYKAKSYNLISIDEEIAISLGTEVEKFKKFSYLIASIITAVTVSFNGIIGFVGLVIPHLVRITLGADHKILIPASFLLGSIYLLTIDTIARTIIAPIEIPIGALTAIIGAPIFLVLLLRKPKL